MPALREAGVSEVEVVANFLSCALGSATLERGCPILGFCRDADGKRRPDVPGPLSTFGSHGGALLVRWLVHQKIYVNHKRADHKILSRVGQRSRNL